jgi:hypothetical protein
MISFSSRDHPRETSARLDELFVTACHVKAPESRVHLSHTFSAQVRFCNEIKSVKTENYAQPAQPPHTSSLAAVREAAAHCTACHLHKRGTQTVFGEGPKHAPIMLVGEQPGDYEDIAGKPFVGPAGKIMDQALEEAGIDRSQLYVTNAVKHFKWEPRGGKAGFIRSPTRARLQPVVRGWKQSYESLGQSGWWRWARLQPKQFSVRHFASPVNAGRFYRQNSRHECSRPFIRRLFFANPMKSHANANTKFRR